MTCWAPYGMKFVWEIIRNRTCATGNSLPEKSACARKQNWRKDSGPDQRHSNAVTAPALEAQRLQLLSNRCDWNRGYWGWLASGVVEPGFLHELLSMFLELCYPVY